MALPHDVLRFVQARFPAEAREALLELLESARLHDGNAPSARCLRSVLVGAGGSLETARRLIALLAIDFRDVILAGEYETTSDGALRRVRDLNQPLPSETDG